MKYDLIKKENGVFEATISVDKAEWEQALNSAYEKNKGKYNIAGFRKGHAPRAIIEKTYGQGAFFNEALDEIYYKSYTTILAEHEEVKPVDAPKLDINKIDENGVEMVMTITCVPEFELAQYKGLTFTRQKAEVTEEQIKEAIERELLRASRLVETNAPVKNDDFVTLDFDGYVDDKQFDGGKAENYQLKIGSHTFIDTFEEQLVGLNIGDKKDVVVTFPAEYHEASLAGKPATFKVEIKNIRERIMPELNEEFVSNSTEFETVDEYKNSIKDRLVKEANDRADLEVENDMLDKVIDDTEFTAPATMVEEETKRQMNGMRAQMQYQGITLEDYAKYVGKTMEELEQEVKNNSARNVKARLVLEKLIKSENLDITEKDIDEKFEEMAKNTGKSLEEFKKQVNNDMVNRIANELLMKKLIAFLRENNTIN
ncbi:MAG: trigger factor [Clostridia bacterium]|nr:trigger factor [Clostridia bacterium]